MADDQLFARFGKTCEPGEVLFREGEHGEEMYVLQEGAIRITKAVKGEEKTLALLGPGEFFGEMAILNAKPRTATAVVEQQAKVLVLGAKAFERMVVSNAEIAVRLIKRAGTIPDRLPLIFKGVDDAVLIQAMTLLEGEWLDALADLGDDRAEQSSYFNAYWSTH